MRTGVRVVKGHEAFDDVLLVQVDPVALPCTKPCLVAPCN